VESSCTSLEMKTIVAPPRIPELGGVAFDPLQVYTTQDSSAFHRDLSLVVEHVEGKYFSILDVNFRISNRRGIVLGMGCLLRPVSS